MAAPPNTTEREPIWRAWRCPRCHYDRAGLPAASACPECGHAPAPDTLVLGANVPAQRKANYINLANAVLVGGTGVTFLLRGGGNPSQGVWRVVIALTMIAVFAYAVVRRIQKRADRDSDFALAIDDAGFEIWRGGKMKKRLSLHCLVDAKFGVGDEPSTIVIKRLMKTRFAIEFPPPPIAEIIGEVRRRGRL